MLGPEILGHATDIIVDGVVSSPSGIDFARAAPHAARSALGAVRRRRPCCRTCRRTCSPASCSARCTGCAPTSRTSSTACRSRYVDRQPRGDLLSRVTNDIDNVAQSLQQTLSQMLTSMLTLVGVLDDDVHRSRRCSRSSRSSRSRCRCSRCKVIAKRSKPRFVAQWRHTGTLNAQVEEAFTGHALVKAFGRQHEVEERFREKNEELYEASFGAQFISGHHPAGDDVPRQPELRRHRRRSAGCGCRPGAMTHRRHPGVHPVLAPVHPAAHAAGVDDQRAAVGHRLGRAGVRAARRRRSRSPDADRAARRRRARRAGSSSTTCRSPTTPTEPAHRGPLAGRRARPDRRHRRARPAPARPRSST